MGIQEEDEEEDKGGGHLGGGGGREEEQQQKEWKWGRRSMWMEGGEKEGDSNFKI